MLLIHIINHILFWNAGKSQKQDSNQAPNDPNSLIGRTYVDVYIPFL